MSCPVELYVYDLSGGLARQFAPMFGLDIEGVWHTSIVVHGDEVFFGSEGIQHCKPGGTSMGPPLRTKEMGTTNLTRDQVQKYLKQLSESDFSGDKYDLFLHNCNTFSNQVSTHLTGHQIPQDILDLPSKVLSSPIVQMLRPVIQNATPTGSKMFDDFETQNLNPDAENIFAAMKEYDARNENENQALTRENLAKLSFYLQKSAANYKS